VRRNAWVVVVLAGCLASPVRGQHLFQRGELDRTNRKLAGHVDDYTNNHGADRRIWSAALCERRDMYVYLPPCYDPCKQYPLIVWLHGFAQDEQSFLGDVVPKIDQAMASGCLPPAIVAAPDGSLNDARCLFNAGSFFINSKAGNYEDFLMVDVWDFLFSHYPLRPEPEAHVIAGVSMGGGAAFNKCIKYPDRFKVVVGIFPPVNLRWENCRGRYMANFDPCCWGWREDFQRPLEPVGRFYFGLVTIRLRQVYTPLFGRRDPSAVERISQENPLEMLELYDVHEGEREMYIAYGGKDEFNIDAQVESFLYVARQRGLTVAVNYDPHGHHNRATAYRLLPGTFQWLAPRLAPYAPCP
jgi:pimeloyl-ACP methyl ester carboxylesterase